MPPKRAKAADGVSTGAKRTKPFTFASPDLGQSGWFKWVQMGSNARIHQLNYRGNYSLLTILPIPFIPHLAIARFKSKFASDSVLPAPNDSEEEDELLIRNYKSKQPQPRPKKKTLSSTSVPAQESVNNKPPPPAAAAQKSTNTSATLANQQSVVSAVKTKKNVNFSHEDQENRERQVLSTSNGNNSSNSNGATKPKDSGKASLKSSKADSSLSSEQLSIALEDIKAKYKRLKQLRETDAERNLQECRAQLEEATHSAENYRAQMEPQLESALRIQEKLRDNNEVLNAKVRTLQRQVREYEEKFRQREQEDKAKAKTALMESVLASPDVTPTSAGALSTIKLLENLSGFKVIPRDINPRSSKDVLPKIWDCEHSGPRGTLRFTLKYDYTNNKISYIPALNEKEDKELMSIIPDYLTDELEFDRQFESKFFWRILNFNHEDS
ncbi:hypothetical protein BGZ80_002581 [Entomortierella chlamydospora]|uniref:Monopolin complex subunit Csm1/Pcs1 C-terminal domain-containing protein n=1 Tax=Entomortierella chlamydospora TaxID=101097 RepID=A0A9P6N163_9FUNG|nr:hypothetical protein BGZ79_006938 [Entomortierella chlamydospora]KAG0021360.1 hypothetical protein BGZ80_002581 [Entomortierella chlamydospora]